MKELVDAKTKCEETATSVKNIEKDLSEEKEKLRNSEQSK